MNAESLKEAIKRELPGWLREDPDLRAYILELTRQEYASRAETQDRFYAVNWCCLRASSLLRVSG